MAASAKSSGTMKNVCVGLLALWSLASLVVIVVWATSPDLKSSARYRTELQETTEKLEGAKVVWSKNKAALEELVEEAREEQQRQKHEILLLLGRLNATNSSLEDSRRENVVLNGNISVLQEETERLRQRETNLTAQIGLRDEHIEAQQQNLTQAEHRTESCFSLKAAADSQMQAAQTQKRACESNQQYLQKQLQKCKVTESEAPQQQSPAPTPGAASPLAGAPALMVLVCGALHLLTCEYDDARMSDIP